MSRCTVTAKGCVANAKVKHPESRCVFVVERMGEASSSNDKESKIKEVSTAAFIAEHTRADEVVGHTFVNHKPDLHNDLQVDPRKAVILKAVVQVPQDATSD